MKVNIELDLSNQEDKIFYEEIYSYAEENYEIVYRLKELLHETKGRELSKQEQDFIKKIEDIMLGEPC